MLLKDAFILDIANNDRNIVLSYGPCQFPTLGFIVERYWEIQSHEPEDFWFIACSHDSDDGTARFNWLRGHLFDHTCAVMLYEMCVEEPTATVRDVKHQEKMKYPPHPLSTVELQKRASRYFRMSSEHTMKVAEELYQAGFISYPRTETDNFSVNTNLHAIVQEQIGHPSWGAYAERLLNPEARLWRNPSNGGHDDKAHPPIHPTKYSSGEASWSPDHLHVYELVVRHFLACVSQPAVGAETIVEIDIAGEQFSASGRSIIAKNYLEVYRFESWGGSIIPNYQTGQQFIPTSLTLDSGCTRPPPLLSESDLLSCMDKAGIGTDATMHDHIKKLLDRCYVTKDANTRFSPTNLGEALVMGYDDMGYELWKPYLRSMMECDMRAVSMGTKTKDEVLGTCLQQMKACFLDARMKKTKLTEAMGFFFERSNRAGGDSDVTSQIVRPCNVCQQSNMVLKKRPDGNYMVGCSQFPLCRNVVWLPASISEATVTIHVCNSCSPGPVFMINFKFHRLKIPPNYDAEHLGCVGCDVIIRELREICGTGSRNIPAAHGQPGATPSSNARRGDQTRSSCTNCRQMGHSSHNCPNASDLGNAQPTRRAHNFTEGTPVRCNSCGEPCVLRTSNTANNRGRKFYNCQSQGCDFFLWADGVDNGAAQTQSMPRGGGRSSSGRGRGSRSRSRGRGRGNAADVTFVTASGEPVSGRCYTCGDSSHFANNCPLRRG